MTEFKLLAKTSRTTIQVTPPSRDRLVADLMVESFARRYGVTAGMMRSRYWRRRGRGRVAKRVAEANLELSRSVEGPFRSLACAQADQILSAWRTMQRLVDGSFVDSINVCVVVNF